MELNFLLFSGAKGTCRQRINDSDLLWIPREENNLQKRK